MVHKMKFTRSGKRISPTRKSVENALKRNRYPKGWSSRKVKGGYITLAPRRSNK